MSKASRAAAPEPPHDPSWTDTRWRQRIRRRLLGWFDTHARDLPWRRTRDAYAIWVSEVMLQQTQVATVVPYFEAFIRDFPDVRALASADISDVLRRWEGLGYYRRAKQMHAAAERMVQQHGGTLPDSYSELVALPGIGRYTAGAILSISADRRLPVVEANTVRLYSRLVALRRPPAEAASNRLLWQVAQSLLPRERCGRFNQAAMELGALLCTPRQPDCAACPLQSLCPTYRDRLQGEIPGPVRTVRYEDRAHVAIVARHGERFFLRCCPPGGHWAGLWDFPRYDVTGQTGESGNPTEIAAEVERRFADEFGFAVRVGEKMHTVRHGVTRFRITLDAFAAEVDARGADSTQSGWYRPQEMHHLPLNTTGRKLAEMLA